MRAPHFAVLLYTVALATALPRSPEWNPREQQVFQYFPDFRYVDPMENPSFMTAKCTSEGVFPHPYNCTWFYRCHDRTGRGFFTTNWFYCEPGTEFDDDLDQCIPKSGTCGDGKDTYFCRTLSSSCRTCNGGLHCEFKECYNGGRDAGIQRICDTGKLFNEQSRSCEEVSGCSVVSSPPGECPLNMMRPAAKWTDEDSGCSVFTGCRAGRNYQETLCNSFYDCQQGTKVLRSCPDGYFFSQQWELCIQPPQKDCTAPPPPPPTCTVSQGTGQGCQEVTGCFNGNTAKTTRRLCSYYTCSQTGTQKFYCQGPGSSYSFSPDSKTCISNIVKCPLAECLPENAVQWVSCTVRTGYRYPNQQKISELLCDEYSCSHTNGLQPCGPGQLFEPDTKTCIGEISPIPPPPPPPCTVDFATLWKNCNNVTGCSDDGMQKTMEECRIFQCSANGEEYLCQLGQMFSPTLKACVTPLSDASCPCTVDRAKFWGNCEDVTGCSDDYQSERTENQCQEYKCSIIGQAFSCEAGKVFSPDQLSCVAPLNDASCPCTVDRAKFWGNCKDVTGCSDDNQSERTENQCQEYKCSITGQAFSCEAGTVFNVFSPDQLSCVAPLNDASCPCTVDRAKFWGNCKDVTGCSDDNQSERTENQCQEYQCSITGQAFSCEAGKVFSPDQLSCVAPLNDASCPCTIDRAQTGVDCTTVTGCTQNNTTRRSEEQCSYFTCSDTGPGISCGGGQVYSPDQRLCVEPLNPNVCPAPVEVCTPDLAKKWDSCNYRCDGNGRKKQMCYFFTCTESLDDKVPCNDEYTEMFDHDTHTCKAIIPECTRSASSGLREGCSPERAQLWFDCSNNNACIVDRSPLQQQSLCGQYTCEAEKISCINGQMYDSENSACVTPLTGKYCSTGIQHQQPKPTFKSWNNQWN